MNGIHRDPKHFYAKDGGPKVAGITTAIKAKDKGYALDTWQKYETGLAAVRNIATIEPHLSHGEIDPLCALCTAGRQKDTTAEQRAARWLTKWPGYVSRPKMVLGSAIHAIAEAMARHEAIDFASIPDEQMPFVESFIRDFIEGGRTPGKAKPRFHPDYIEYAVYRDGDEWCEAYGGTMDVAAALGDDIVLLDHKTGSGVYDEVRLQLAAGSNGTVAGRLCPGCIDDTGKTPHKDSPTFRLPKVTAHAILHIRPDRAEYLPYRITERDFRAFSAARDLWQWEHEWRKAA